MRNLLLLCSCVFVLGACGSGEYQGGNFLPQVTYSHLEPYPIYIAAYHREGFEDVQSLKLPSGFVNNPGVMIADFLDNRFKAVGGNGKVIARLKDLRVDHDIVNSQNEFVATFGVDRKDHYTVTVSLAIESLGFELAGDMGVVINASKELFISEHVSVYDREKQIMDGMKDMVDKLDVAIQDVLKNQMHLMN